MDKLTIEEKAEAYDEAIERAKKWYNAPNIDKMPTYGNRIIEEIFPELKESDEKIKEEIINYFRCQSRDEPCRKSIHDKWIAWLEKQDKIVAYYEDRLDECACKYFNKGYKHALEKQGGKNAIMNVPPREVILSIWDLGNEWKELTNGSISTEYGTQLDYIQKHWEESEYYLRAKQGERKPQRIISAEAKEAMYGKPIDKVEPKFKVGDVVCDKSCTTLDKGAQPNLEIVDIRNGLYICDKGYIPISYQDEYVLVAKKIENEIEIPFGAKDSELQEATYFIPQGFHAEIDDDKVVIKKGEKSTAWSEEDEKIYSRICYLIHSAAFENYDVDEVGKELGEYAKITDWLKAIKTRCAWKPSEEQIEALKEACNEHWEPDGLDLLYTLYQELKKLKRE